MSESNFEVDTVEVRALAKKCGKLANSVKSLSTGNVEKMMASVRESLKGETAEALKDELTDMNTDIRSIASGMAEVQRALNK